MDTNKRLLLAFALSFLVLIGYSYLVPQKNLANSEINKTKQEEIKKDAPKVANTQTNSSAPSVNTSAKSAPITQAKKAEIITTIDTKKYTLTIDNLGRFNSIILKDKKYKTKDGKPIDILANLPTKPLEIRFADTNLNNLAFKNSYSVSSSKVDATNSAQKIELTQNLGDVTLKKIITFYPEGNYNLKVEISKPTQYFITPGFRPMVDKTRYLVVRGVLLRDTNGVIKTFESGDVNSVQNYDNILITAAVDRYYANVFYSNNPLKTIVQPVSVDGKSEPLVFINANGNLDINGYSGAKEWELFSKLDPKLIDVIEFGWFTFLAKPFFKVMLAIYHFVGNWGWAIVLFTILVKLVLFPLSYKGLMSMQKMKDLAPKMKEIREKYANDPAKMNQQMMALYKKHGANPLGGCLPMLIQIPIFFALYRVLLNADELQGAPWILWIQDLSRMDPYFVLPILMGVTMYLQQKLTPNTMTDPMQQKIFNFLPVIMTIFFITFPSGLVLYWLTNNILTIAQQVYINKAYEKYKQSMKAKAK